VKATIDVTCTGTVRTYRTARGREVHVHAKNVLYVWREHGSRWRYILDLQYNMVLYVLVLLQVRTVLYIQAGIEVRVRINP